MKYYYFISYMFDDGSRGIGYGNICFDTKRKIRTFDDCQEIIKEIEKSGINKITLLSINLLDSK